MTHYDILEMENKGDIGEEPKEVHKSWSCQDEIILGYDEYYTEECGFFERFYCKGCAGIRNAGEE